jgi:hypothetical protein
MLPGRGLEYIDKAGAKHSAIEKWTFVAADGGLLPWPPAGAGLTAWQLRQAACCARPKLPKLPGRSAALFKLQRVPGSEPALRLADAGVEMPLEEGTSAFITMNPGYIGRAGGWRLWGLANLLQAAPAACHVASRRPLCLPPTPPNCRCRAARVAQGAVPAHHRHGAGPAAHHGEHAHGGGLCGGQGGCVLLGAQLRVCSCGPLWCWYAAACCSTAGTVWPA